MKTPKQPSPSTLAEAEAILQDLKPYLIEMVERNDPSVAGLKFDDIEANSAAVGDLLAKLLMTRSLSRQGKATPDEELAARKAALSKSKSDGAPRPAEDLQMTRIPRKPRKLKTMRGEITFSRDYLYFPELQTGVFPPGNTAGHHGG